MSIMHQRRRRPMHSPLACRVPGFGDGVSGPPMGYQIWLGDGCNLNILARYRRYLGLRT